LNSLIWGYLDHEGGVFQEHFSLIILVILSTVIILTFEPPPQPPPAGGGTFLLLLQRGEAGRGAGTMINTTKVGQVCIIVSPLGEGA
jgi:hypothetical protein